MYDISGDSDIASTVINESEAEGEEARKFLEDVRETFPQVCKFGIDLSWARCFSCSKSP